MTMVHDAMTGMLRVLIADGGLLTELRTAAAGAVATDLLARPGARSAAVIGTGLGIQDAAVAALAARLAGEHGTGRDVPLGDR
jgi:ornithine cyclodeaminase